MIKNSHNAGQINKMITVSRFEILMFFRGKKIYGMLAITIAISALFIAIIEYLQPPMASSEDFGFSTPLRFVFFLIVLFGAFFGSNSIVTESHQKTGQLLLSNPVSRTTIWFGKFVAAELISIGILLLYYSIITVYAAIGGHQVPTEVLTSLLFSVIALTMVMGISFLISSIFRGPTGAAVAVFVLFIIILPMADNIMTTYGEFKPWFTPSFSAEILNKILVIPYQSDSIVESSLGTPFSFNLYIPDISHSLAVMFSYIVISCVFSIYLFKRKEMG